MASMTGEVRTAMRDLLADIVGLKHEVQTSITAASLRKAALAESATSVRDDVGTIRAKLQAILRTTEDRANSAVADKMAAERDTINTEILFLEEQHKRLEETEAEVRSKTSNISLKVMKEGRDVCDASRSDFTQYMSSVQTKKLQFVLHPYLANILEQIETFTMGEVKVVEMPTDKGVGLDEREENSTESVLFSSHPSTDSNSPRHDTNAQLSMKSSTPSGISRDSNVQRSNKSVISRSNSSNKITMSSVRSDPSQSVQDQPKTLSREPSRNTVSLATVKSVISRPQTRQSKTSLDMSKNTPALDSIGEIGLGEDLLKPVAGLNATFAARSTSEPLINLLSKERSVFIKEDKGRIVEHLHPELGYRETLRTKEHKDACYITGIAVLGNKNVVLCDNVHDSLQMYNPEDQQISELECSHPWGVAAVSDNAVAVTLHYDHKVALIKADTHLVKLDKEIKLKCLASLTYDVKYYDYRLYVLCGNGDVHVTDVKGKEYSVIKTGMLPSVLKYFDVDVEKKTLVVSGDNGVACVTFHGIYSWHYRPKSKFHPTGVAVVNGHVIVCDWENHCIVQITEAGAKVTTVVGENMERPVAIATDGERGAFFLSQGDYEMDGDKTRSIKVFEPVTVDP